MDEKFIILMKDNGSKIVTREKVNGQLQTIVNPAAENKIREKITLLFIKVGLQRSMDGDRFSQEVQLAAHSLLEDIVADSKYWGLRIEEIEYCFNNGLKGRLSDDKDIVVSYKTIIRWLEKYVSHPVYRDAVTSIRNRPVPPERQIAPHKTTEEDIKKSISEAYKDYVAYMSAGVKKATDGIKTLGEAIGMPITCMDYGGIRRRWLVSNGYANEGDSLANIFEKARRNGGKFVKVEE